MPGRGDQVLDVTEVGRLGLTDDLPYGETPPNAWTTGRNVRMSEGKVIAFPGHVRVAENPALADIWAIQGVTNPVAHYWVHVGATTAGPAAIYAYDGSSFTDLTPAGGFAGSRTDLIIGDTLNQNAVLTNNVNVPVTWDLLLGGPFVPLPAWDPTWRARGIKTFKGFLIAYDIAEAGTRFPYRVRWSDQAQPGGLPDSWDATDPTVLAGAQDLGDTDSFIIGALPLRDQFLLYTERETLGMQLIQGSEVFRFFTVSRQSGLLASRAVATFRGKHIVLTEDDVIATNGQTVESVIDHRRRNWLFRRICPNSYGLSFMVVHPVYNEVWLAFPSEGCGYCDTALVWNWRDNNWGVRDLPVGCLTGAIVLDIVGRAALTWNTNPFKWSNWNQTWSQRTYDNALSTLVLGGDGDPVDLDLAPLFRTEEGNLYDGETRQSVVEKLGIRLDADQEVVVHEVWPRTQGGDCIIRLGMQDVPNGPVRWDPDYTFSPTSQDKITCRLIGKYFCIAVESENAAGLELEGYRVRYRTRGAR